MLPLSERMGLTAIRFAARLLTLSRRVEGEVLPCGGRDR
jgi:hypothetical protein